nr:Dna2/Cas4 domain-containing protein [Verrucomicrobiota bacterium]
MADHPLKSSGRPARGIGEAAEDAPPLDPLATVVQNAFAAAVQEDGETAPVADLPEVPAAEPESPVVDPAAADAAESGLSLAGSSPGPVGAPHPASETDAAGDSQAPTEPLPARMLNEFVYCPRLFYYEHVEGVFVENADTKRGASLHRRVDGGSGALPAAARKAKAGSRKSKEPGDGVAEEGETREAGTEEEVIHSRSVTLGSERLGVIAKLDLVEARAVHEPAGGKEQEQEQDKEEQGEQQAELFARLEVWPVDYKAGAPREGEDGGELWPTDKMQLGLQILILRDNGYHCAGGIIYYRATKQRARLAMTPELETWVCEQVAAARRTMAGPIPPPLIGSPKCVRCSLNSVCLPDETRLLESGASFQLANPD